MASSARFDELKKKFDENPRRYFAPLANEFRKTGDAAQAVMICEEFLPQQPGHMSGHIVYGQALFDLGRLDEARTVFETALTLDPENLIALRHLGDIARAHGDPESARHWYQRVLDADPRNEEVQSLVGELDASGTAGPATTPPDAGHADTIPLVDLAPPAADLAPSAVDMASPAVDLAEPLEVAPPLPSQPPALPTHASLLELDVVEEPVIAPPPPAAAEAPFDSISLEGLEATSASGPGPEVHGRAEGFEPMEFSAPHAAPAIPDGIADTLEPGEFSAPAAPIAPLAGLEDSAVGAFEARPAASPPLPDLEPMPELTADSSEQLPVDIPPEVIAAEAELIDAREAFSSAPKEAAASTAAAPAAERPAPAAQFESAAPAASPVSSEPPRVTPSQPFVTETMAELYVKQGFREQALDVYKLLLAASPESKRLRDRVAELQAPVEEDSGPSVREFFARLAARTAGNRSAAAEPPAVADFAEFDSFETVNGTEAAVAEPAPPAEAAKSEPAPSTPAESRAPTSSGAQEAGDGSIDALFGQRPVPSSDATAASALAQAFGSAEPETPPITGRPARAAAGELSLDSVFRDGGARPPRNAQSFSFDQFFSQSATTGRADESAPAPTPSQGTSAQSEPAERTADDIEQFNSWLQGLKQR